MPKEKRKKGIFDLFGFDEDKFLFDAKSFSGGGLGYSMSVTYDDKGKPIVKVQTQGEVDVAELRRDIEQRYPGARIEGLEKQPLIRFVGEEPEAKETEKKKEAKKKKERQSFIRIVE